MIPLTLTTLHKSKRFIRNTLLLPLKPYYYDIEDRQLMTEGKLLISVAEKHSLKPKVVVFKLSEYLKKDTQCRKKYLESLGFVSEV
jgi:hypothetical protein